MITTGEMQISGMLTMLILSVMLVICAPGPSTRRISFAKARWLMAAGTGLIALQFLLQHTFGFRQMGVTQAVCCNLLFFTPSSLLCSMAILYVQRQGNVNWQEWLTSSGICALSAIILIGTAVMDGVPFREESGGLRIAEYVSSVLFVVMQTYIFAMQYKAYRRLEQAVDEYYDRSRRDLLGWMGLSMKAMALLVFLVPLVIFMEGTPLVLFSIAFFFSISYSTISLYSYGISEDMEIVEEAESLSLNPSPNSEENFDSDQGKNAQLSTINAQLESWIAAGHYREHNLSLGIVAHQMGVPQKHLQLWLRQSEYEKLAGLVSKLRIEEAKRVLEEYPQWSIEYVADYCGFNNRKYFHEIFRQYTGMTPAKYQLSRR